ncbi:MAG: hypothetical protein JRF54_14520 [Deltaproteobacteria bacterium]|nr:hypothetical protein [Deltaproteobacteria bacterium]
MTRLSEYHVSDAAGDALAILTRCEELFALCFGELRGVDIGLRHLPIE